MIIQRQKVINTEQNYIKILGLQDYLVEGEKVIFQ